MANHFTREVDGYRRNLDVLTAYKKDMATGLSLMFKRPYEEALQYVESVTGEGGDLSFKDPALKYVGRDDHGDRVIKVTTFMGYLRTIERHDLIVSPSLTIYQNPKVKRSISSIYIAINVKGRNTAKHEEHSALEAKQFDLATYKANEQQTRKIMNNALSGAHVSSSTVLFCPTIHSTLTSTCRTASGFGNANNEKILTGNRHYWSPDIVEANILAIINHVDLPELQRVMTVYGLRHPTVAETMDVIEWSTQFYWRDTRRMNDIRDLVASLQDIHRSAFVYVGDLHHLAKYNDAMMRTFLSRLAQRPTTGVENYAECLTGMTDEMVAFVSLLNGDLLQGKSLKKIESLPLDSRQIVGATAANVKAVLDEYVDFIRIILVTDVVPASLAHLPHIMRRCAVTSDTDSTIFTVQYWLAWYAGEISFEREAVNIGHAIAFLTSASITHVLAIMSANIGIQKSQLHQYAMKSEFWFPVFALTSRAKTYYAIQAAKEGIVFDYDKFEIKGAVLKGSNSPAYIVDGVDAMLKRILLTIRKGELLELNDLLQEVADMEHRIFKAIRSGDTTFYKSGEVKPLEGYKKKDTPGATPYFHYLLWQEVFAPKYGNAPDLPYGTIKVNIEAGNRTEFARWIAGFEDPGMRQRMIEFLPKYSKDMLGMIHLPKAVVESAGVPQELIDGAGIRRIVSNLMEPYYVLLESVGYFAIDPNQQRLVSDFVPPSEPKG